MPQSLPPRSTKRWPCSAPPLTLATVPLATVIFLSLRLGRPLFLEGEAGVGKTEVAKVLAASLGSG